MTTEPITRQLQRREVALAALVLVAVVAVITWLDRFTGWWIAVLQVLLIIGMYELYASLWRTYRKGPAPARVDP